MADEAAQPYWPAPKDPDGSFEPWLARPPNACLRPDSRPGRRAMMVHWLLVETASAAHSQPKTVVLCLRGDLDVTVRTRLAKILAPLPGRHPDQLVIDMTEVNFLDCGSAAVVLNAVRQALPPAVKPVIRSPGPIVRRLLEITGWDKDCIIDTPPSDGPAKSA